MSDLRCIIIEDEPPAVKILTDYIAAIPFLKLQGVFKDTLLARDFLRNHQTDLIFLDIHVPRLKGMDFLRSLTDPPAVIITTAYHQYAVEGFEMNVVDYLLKPFSFERFLGAVTKVNANSDKFLFLTIRQRKVKIIFSEIVYIESQREYIKIITTHGDHVLKITTKEIERLLPAHLFKRIHRSFIVSMDKIGAYTAGMVDVNGNLLPVGRNYRSVLDDLARP